MRNRRIRAVSRLLAGSGRPSGAAGRAAARRTGLTGFTKTGVAVAALVPVLALTAACGGGGKKAPQDVRASGAVSTAKLTQAMLTSGDVDHVQVLPAGSKTQLLGGPQQADPAVCEPIADQWSSRPEHPRQVYVGGMLTDTADKDKNAKTISLTVVASYKKGEAKQSVDDLAAALRTCTSYRTTRGGVTTTFQVKAVPQPSPAGDQQLAYTIADASKGDSGRVLVTVVRVGDTTAAYESVRADHKPATLRAAIPAKQTEKLRKAAASG